MKNSGIEWIGEIPDSWRVGKLKNHLISYKSGGTPDSSNEEYYTDIGTPWVVIADMTANDYIKDTTKHISKLKKDLEIKSKDKILAKKDCFSAVTFSYYETGCHFCVVVGSKEGLDNIEEYWNKFLDKEWR